MNPPNANQLCLLRVMDQFGPLKKYEWDQHWTFPAASGVQPRNRAERTVESLRVRGLVKLTRDPKRLTLIFATITEEGRKAAVANPL